MQIHLVLPDCGESLPLDAAIDGPNTRVGLRIMCELLSLHQDHIVGADGHRGGCDVVEVYIITELGQNVIVGTVEVAGLLALPTRDSARISVNSAMHGTSNPIIRQRCVRGHSWDLWLRSGANGKTFRRPPGHLLWPTDPYYGQQLQDGDITVAVVFEEEESDGGSEHVGPEALSGVLGSDAFVLSGTKHTTICEPWLGHPAFKRVRHGTVNAGGVPASAVRAVLFTDNRPDSLLQLEAALLYHRGLVLSVVCPSSIHDITDCLDTVRPRVVIISTTHCGE